MKYSKTLNIWLVEDLVKSGKVKLQSGQVIKCGSSDNHFSIFDYATPHYIRAYHGRTIRHARGKYLAAKKMQQLAERCQLGLITAKVMQAGFKHAAKRYTPLEGVFTS